VLIGGKRFKGDCLVDFDGNRLWCKPAELRMIEQSKVRACVGRLIALRVGSSARVNRVSMAVLYGCAGCLTAQNGCFRPGRAGAAAKHARGDPGDQPAQGLRAQGESPRAVAAIYSGRMLLGNPLPWQMVHTTSEFRARLLLKDTGTVVFLQAALPFSAMNSP